MTFRETVFKRVSKESKDVFKSNNDKTVKKIIDSN